jgi:hypothetical protein
MAETLEDSAQRIAEKGREALRERLRQAFEEAATSHAAVLDLSPERLEQMFERAADMADGLQWRRALAAVAAEDLGIGLGEALDHPAVARAQELVGAPSYEEGLTAIAEGKPPPPGTARARPAPEIEAESPADADTPADRTPEGLELVVGVIHRHGLPELEGPGAFELHFSEDGLAVIRAGDRAALASFSWTELEGIEVTTRRGWRRHSARVLVSASGHRARFDAPDLEPEELKRRLAPVFARLGSSE